MDIKRNNKKTNVRPTDTIVPKLRETYISHVHGNVDKNRSHIKNQPSPSKMKIPSNMNEPSAHIRSGHTQTMGQPFTDANINEEMRRNKK